MLRSLILALCATLFTIACATAPKVKGQEEEPRWVSGELNINFTTDPPQVKLCITRLCDVGAEYSGSLKSDNGSAAYNYQVPEQVALRYDQIQVQKTARIGGMQWLAYAISYDFGNVGCTRWFLAVPHQEEGGITHPEGQRFTIQYEPERMEGCEYLTPDEYQPAR